MIRRAAPFADTAAPARDPGAGWPAPCRANVLALLPARDESANLGQVLAGVLRQVEQVLVVDDGSGDDTARIAASVPGVAVVRIPQSGKGAALRVGFRHAVDEGFDWVLTLDSDGQHDPDEIPRFFEAARHGAPPVIVGSRRGALEGMPLLRRATNVFMSWLVSRYARQRIPDSQNGFRLISTRLLREVPLTTSNFETESELLVNAGRRGFEIGSVPVSTIYRKGGKSHIRKVPDTLRFLRLCARKPWLSESGPALRSPASIEPEKSTLGEPQP